MASCRKETDQDPEMRNMEWRLTFGKRLGRACEGWRDPNDVRRAYYYAYAPRHIYIALPKEDHAAGMVGRLRKSMH